MYKDSFKLGHISVIVNIFHRRDSEHFFIEGKGRQQISSTTAIDYNFCFCLIVKLHLTQKNQCLNRLNPLQHSNLHSAEGILPKNLACTPKIKGNLFKLYIGGIKIRKKYQIKFMHSGIIKALGNLLCKLLRFLQFLWATILAFYRPSFRCQA